MSNDNRNMFNCTCEHCRKKFYRSPSAIRELNFCGKKCYTLWQTGRKRRNAEHNCECSICKKKLYIKPSRIKRTNEISCSIECSAIVKSLNRISEIEERAGIKNLYDVIKIEYESNFKSIRDISTIVFGKETYASTISSYMDLFGIEKRQGSEAVKTQWIDNDKRRKQASDLFKEARSRPEVINKINEYRKSKEFREAISVANSGENNGMWNPNLSDEERQHHIKRARRIPGYQNFRRKVYERDNYTCQICRDNTGGNLVVHHLNGFHWDAESRTEVDNGVTLCNECHNEFHSMYGRTHNNLFQFAQYVEMKASNN